MNNEGEWYRIDNVGGLDSPSLALFPDRIKENIRILKKFVPDTQWLRPHVKTHKSPETARMLMDEGILKFKCATIAEAEMLALAHAPDILLAYQPVGPKGIRLAELVDKYPSSIFSCLVDNYSTAVELSSLFEKKHSPLRCFIDLNVGMNRTGIPPSQALDLFKQCQGLKGISILGLHAYDGHLRDTDINIRSARCNEGYKTVDVLRKEMEKLAGKKLTVIAGGTPTFPIHALRSDVECSPGTFIFWDKGYEALLPEQPFLFSAVVITRIISKPDENTLCTDLGHKSIASENPLSQRVFFLNAPEVQFAGHSEEHLVLKTEKPNRYKVGDVLYGVPYHVCPTIALHDMAYTVTGNKATGTWEILSRKRKITV